VRKRLEVRGSRFEVGGWRVGGWRVGGSRLEVERRKRLREELRVYGRLKGDGELKRGSV